MKTIFKFCLAAALALPLAGHGQVLSLDPYARMNHIWLDEVSGMARSTRQDDLYWVVNDSGDEARLFSIRADGSSVIPTYSRFSRWADSEESGKQPWQGFRVLYGTNVDWEDMTSDDSYLYIADTGNNGNARQDLVIYAVGEIDPTASTQAAVIRRFPVRYPEQADFPPAQRHYDSESLFIDGETLYLITKHRDAGLMHRITEGAKLYRLDTRFEDRVNDLVLVDSHEGILGATSAELSPDGQTLAVLSGDALWLFSRPDSGDHWLSSASRRIEFDPDSFRQAETVVWESDESLIVTNEQRDMFRIFPALAR